MSYFHLDMGNPSTTAAAAAGKSIEDGRRTHSLSLLTKSLGGQELAKKELDLPLCVTCSAQTSYDGEDLTLTGEDSAYKCPVCLDPRQYIGVQGQKWTTLRRLITSPPKDAPLENHFDELIPGAVWTFKTKPAFGIGQRAFLIKDTELSGLVMWDCVAYLDDATMEKISELSDGKGIAHMIISHPHYYSTTATWLAAFPTMQLWLAEADFAPWYMRKDVVNAYESLNTATPSSTTAPASRIRLVSKEQTRVEQGCPNVTILLLGGHFPGSLVLLWKDVLFIADTIQVVPSGLYKSDEPQRDGVVSVTFLWSYPNQIPLSGAEIARVCAPLENVSFTRAFGAFEGFDIWGHAKEKILQSRDIFCQRLRAK